MQVVDLKQGDKFFTIEIADGTLDLSFSPSVCAAPAIAERWPGVGV